MISRSRPTRRRSGLLVTAMASLALACGGSSTPTTAATAAPPPTTTSTSSTTSAPAAGDDCPAPGFVRHAGDDFSLCLWDTLVPESPDTVQINSLLEASLEGDAQEIDEIETTFQDTLVFAAFDRTTPTFVDNFFLLQQPAFPIELSRGAPIVAGYVAQVGATDIETAIEELAFGETVVVTYRIPVSDAEGVIYVFQTDFAQWVMALNASDLDKYDDGLLPVVESFVEVR